MKMYLPPPGEKPSRRGVLKKGLLGGVVLALGGGTWLFTRPSASIDLPEGLRVLNAREYACLHALVQRFIPPHENFPDADALNTTVAADGVMAMMEEVTRDELKQLINLFENALPAFLFGRRRQTFSMLPMDQQFAVIDEWRDSKLTLRRTGYLALRGLVMAAYYGNPKTWPAVKYPGPPAGIHDPNAPVWKGGDAARPMSNGKWNEAPAEPADGGTP